MNSKHTIQQKVAILLTALGEEVASEILKSLPEKTTKTLLQTIHGLQSISQDEVDQLLEEFLQVLSQPSQGLQADPGFARRVLQNISDGQADDLLPNTPRFECLDPLEGEQIAHLVRNEHPQTIALVLTQLPARKLATTFQALPNTLHTEIMLRIAKLDQVDTQTLFDLEETLEAMISKSQSQQLHKVGGIEQVAKLLQNTNPELAQQLLEGIKNHDQDLADHIEGQLFQFQDLLKMDNNSLRELFQALPGTTWMIALRGQDKVTEKVLENVSARAAETFKEDLIALPKQRLSDVQQAQQEILQKAKNMAEEGKIRLPQDGETWV